MRGGMPFSPSLVLPEKMISMHRILLLTAIRQLSCRDNWIIASNRTGKLRHHNERRLVMGSFPAR
jgi:hypothetical protein